MIKDLFCLAEDAEDPSWQGTFMWRLLRGRKEVERRGPPMLPPTARLCLFPLLILTGNALIASRISRVIPKAVKLTLRINHDKYLSVLQDLTPMSVSFQLCYCLAAHFKSSACLHSHQYCILKCLFHLPTSVVNAPSPLFPFT